MSIIIIIIAWKKTRKEAEEHISWFPVLIFCWFGSPLSNFWVWVGTLGICGWNTKILLIFITLCVWWEYKAFREIFQSVHSSVYKFHFSSSQVIQVQIQENALLSYIMSSLPDRQGDAQSARVCPLSSLHTVHYRTVFCLLLHNTQLF